MNNLYALSTGDASPLMDPIYSALPLRARATEDGPSLQPDTVPGDPPASFSSALAQLIEGTRSGAVASQSGVESFARGEQAGRIHGVMVASSKAEISLRTLVTVRNKLVDAYKELLHVTT